MEGIYGRASPMPPEVQRAVAEVWGATLRRLKVSLREDAVRMVAGCADSELGDAWIFVTACKVRSVSGFSLSLFSAFL